ncbi:hypothetical protein N657DRAFT_247075 [Parathielavia appendiculata]|uniref:Uncharacterized protein n=1 Tax=Parathielavia appendiculata TaxID=2587402 RepID=A0AAN6TTQ2_9PEZI|nr:hypothetical protein N657DRAFT_247075 [Parathielavia appendiculata]
MKLFVENQEPPKQTPTTTNKLKSTAPTASTVGLGAKPGSLRRVFLMGDSKPTSLGDMVLPSVPLSRTPWPLSQSSVRLQDLPLHPSLLWWLSSIPAFSFPPSMTRRLRTKTSPSLQVTTLLCASNTGMNAPITKLGFLMMSGRDGHCLDEVAEIIWAPELVGFICGHRVEEIENSALGVTHLNGVVSRSSNTRRASTQLNSTQPNLCKRRPNSTQLQSRVELVS